MSITALCFVFSLGVIADTALTYDWVRFRGGRESNPFWVGKLKYPALVVCLDFTIISGFTLAMTGLAKRDKPLAAAIAIAGCIVQGYFIYRHFKVRGWI